MTNYILPVSEATRASSARAMEGLREGSYLEQYLTNKALPFDEKQASYLLSYERSMRSRNHRYIMECIGEER